MSQEEADIRERARAPKRRSSRRRPGRGARLDVEFTHVTVPPAASAAAVTEATIWRVGTQGTLLTTLVSLDPIYAYVDADERSYLKYIRLAQRGERPSSRVYHNPVWIGLADEEGFPHEGAMDFVDNQLDRGTGTIIGRALLPNPDLTLTPGLFARLRFRQRSSGPAHPR